MNMIFYNFYKYGKIISKKNNFQKNNFQKNNFQKNNFQKK